MSQTLPGTSWKRTAARIIAVGIDAPDDGPKRASEYLAVADTIRPYKFVPRGDRLPAFTSQQGHAPHRAPVRVNSTRASTAVGEASCGGVAAMYLLMTMPDTINLG